MHVLQLIKKNMMALVVIMCVLFSDTVCQDYYNPFIKDHSSPPELVVLITSYNNEKFFYRNLDSVVNQKIKTPFRIIYVNDCSTDKTGPLVDSYIRTHGLESLVTVIHNEKRIGALANLYNVIHTLPDHVLVVQTDGDDFFAHDRAVERIAQEHMDRNVWLSCSQLIYYPEGNNGSWLSEEFPQYVLDNNSFRSYKWVTYHVKTFYAGLFKRIQREDLLHNGEFFPMTWDFAIMFPMLEMASRGHISFIPDILYVYNHHNPIGDRNTNAMLQRQLGGVICAKPKYDPIEAN